VVLTHLVFAFSLSCSRHYETHRLRRRSDEILRIAQLQQQASAITNNNVNSRERLKELEVALKTKVCDNTLLDGPDYAFYA